MGILDAIRERKRTDAINKALSDAYQPPIQGGIQVSLNPDANGQPSYLPSQGQEGSFNYQNALANLYKSGYGSDALALDEQRSNNEIARLLKIAEVNKASLRDAPKTRDYPVGDNGMTRTEEWDPRAGVWNFVAQGRKVPQVSISNSPENKGLSKLAEEEAQLVSDLKKNSIGGAKLLGPLNRMEQLNSSGNVAQGPLANFNQELGKFAIYLGAGDDVKKRVAAGEQYFSAAADVIRDKIKALGAGTAVSNVDLLFTRQSIGDLTNTQTGRALIIKAMKQDLKNIQQLSQAADKHFRGQGRGSLSGFDPASSVTILPELNEQAPQASAQPSAYNPQTGERLILRNGQWQPIK